MRHKKAHPDTQGLRQGHPGSRLSSGADTLRRVSGLPWCSLTSGCPSAGSSLCFSGTGSGRLEDVWAVTGFRGTVQKQCPFQAYVRMWGGKRGKTMWKAGLHLSSFPRGTSNVCFVCSWCFTDLCRASSSSGYRPSLYTLVSLHAHGS